MNVHPDKFLEWWENDGGETVNDAMRRIRAEALAVMPVEDAERAAEGLYFAAEVGTNASYHAPKHIRGRGLVLFSEAQLYATDATEVCLHEIAHFILDHYHPPDIDAETIMAKKGKQELQAWELVAKWTGRSRSWAKQQVDVRNAGGYDRNE